MAKEQAASTRGTGTDTLEIKDGDASGIDPNTQHGKDIRERFNDPNAARKAIIARHAALTQADREIDLETVPGAKTLQGGYEEGGDAATEDGDATVDGAMQPQREVVAPAADAVVDSAATGGDELVTLKVFGKEIQESRSAVEAAGGKEARQIQLAAEERLRRGGEHLAHAESDARRAEELGRVAADKRRAFNEQLKILNGASRPTESPTVEATVPAVRQPASAETPAPRGAVDESQIENLVTELYSGDPDRAKAALADVLAAVRGSPNATLEQMAALEERYGDTIMAKGNEHLRRDCALLYNAEIVDPKNRGRPLVVIADEVATRVLGRAGIVDAPNADVAAAVSTRTNFKRRIPAASSATDRVPAQETQPEYPTKPSDVVNLLRAARHQPVY
jgi:hypothetical protein